HHDVRQIARVRPVRVLDPVPRPQRIEMRARRLETRRIALPRLVNVDPPAPGREPRDLDRDPDPVPLLREHGRPDPVPVPSDEFDPDRGRSLAPRRVAGLGIRRFARRGSEHQQHHRPAPDQGHDSPPLANDPPYAPRGRVRITMQRNQPAGSRPRPPPAASRAPAASTSSPAPTRQTPGTNAPGPRIPAKTRTIPSPVSRIPASTTSSARLISAAAAAADGSSSPA